MAAYMEAANRHYYSNRESIGATGDFTTAPEISQMFGELVGLWLADLWQRAGRPDCHYVELGPGHGTLASDALRAMRIVNLHPPANLVETSPMLRRRQAELLPSCSWHAGLETLPEELPLLIVANEFFDALPVHQYDFRGEELRIAWANGRFVRTGEVDRESSPASIDVMSSIADRLALQGGAALIVDYGHMEPAHGDTLQAVSSHAFADPWVEPGERDLTAHVDFHALAGAAVDRAVRVHGPVSQGEWLETMGIAARAEALSRAHPERASEIAAARVRLTDAGAMGALFKVLALTAPSWPEPAGFE